MEKKKKTKKKKKKKWGGGGGGGKYGKIMTKQKQNHLCKQPNWEGFCESKYCGIKSTLGGMETKKKKSKNDILQKKNRREEGWVCA